jgi:hypothetical protein
MTDRYPDFNFRSNVRTWLSDCDSNMLLRLVSWTVIVRRTEIYITYVLEVRLTRRSIQPFARELGPLGKGGLQTFNVIFHILSSQIPGY